MERERFLMEGYFFSFFLSQFDVIKSYKIMGFFEGVECLLMEIQTLCVFLDMVLILALQSRVSVHMLLSIFKFLYVLLMTLGDLMNIPAGNHNFYR